MVIDCISYNNEAELFDLRYNILSPYVDEFIVCESPHTFSMKPKPLYFERIKDKYPKVKYWINPENYDSDLISQAIDSPYTQGADHWKEEWLQKESIRFALNHLHDDDTVFIGDCDEIWDEQALDLEQNVKLRLKVYTYYLNNRSSEEFWGPIKTTYKTIKENYLNDLRNRLDWRTAGYYGWHFTSLKDNLKQKLEASYTPETYASEAIMANLDQNIANNKDFLGRDFTYRLDESEWPEYLKAHQDNYQHLCQNI